LPGPFPPSSNRTKSKGGAAGSAAGTSRRTRRIFEPQQKITAVLSIWTEQRTIRHVCREMSFCPVLLNHWQNQAMGGMLQALNPKKPDPLVKKNLPDPTAELEKRLKAVQSAAKANPA
jgi:transposase-like protein